ncbi:MAG: DUF4139 domain-containing protein [Arenimonas sp.]
MKLNILAASTTLGLALMSNTTQAADGSLTIYSGDYESVAQSEASAGSPGFALFERKLGFDLKSGDNEVSLGGMPKGMDSSSLILKPDGNAKVRGQRFDFAIAGQDELLRRALGQTVTVEQAVGNERQTYTGQLMSAGNGLTLKLADGRIKVLSNYASFELPRLPAGVVNEPTMHWTINNPNASHENFVLSYATSGLAWRAEYLVSASGFGKECKMDIEGAAMVVNRSGTDFNNVMLTLVAGQPNRAPSAGPQMMAAAAPMMRKNMMVADGAPDAQASGEYQAYKLPNAGSLPQGSVQRLPLVNAANNIACERRYETNYSLGDWMPPYPIIDANYGAGDDQELPVFATLRFKNSKAVGLGVPLPAGRVRMFDGKDFLGEANINHTAANQDVTLQIGNVFDLKSTRTREDFQIDRDGRTMVERIKIKLINSKAQAATVRVSERLPRWTNWEMVSNSVPFEKRGAQTVSFDVPLAADSETTLTYTVRYRWAADIKIPN